MHSCLHQQWQRLPLLQAGNSVSTAAWTWLLAQLPGLQLHAQLSAPAMATTAALAVQPTRSRSIARLPDEVESAVLGIKQVMRKTSSSCSATAEVEHAECEPRTPEHG
jgi:hypothetical protein